MFLIGCIQIRIIVFKGVPTFLKTYEHKTDWQLYVNFKNTPLIFSKRNLGYNMVIVTTYLGRAIFHAVVSKLSTLTKNPAKCRAINLLHALIYSSLLPLFFQYLPGLPLHGCHIRPLFSF